jgi:hypothetical protein
MLVNVTLMEYEGAALRKRLADQGHIGWSEILGHWREPERCVPEVSERAVAVFIALFQQGLTY